MSCKRRLVVPALLLCLCLPAAALCGQQNQENKLMASLGEQDAKETPADQTPLHMDKDLAREHELFSNFAHNQVERMNATIIGGRQSMQVHRGADGLYRATYRAIDLPGMVCQVRRSESNPSFYVGSLIYKEQVLQSVGKSPEACRKGPFEPVSEKSNRLIYTSVRGGGWR